MSEKGEKGSVPSKLPKPSKVQPKQPKKVILTEGSIPPKGPKKPK